MRLRKLLLALSFTAGLAMAEGTDPEGMENLSLADLMNIKLQTGSFLELDLSKSPVTMTILSKDQVSLSGARHLTELLEIYVPGFQYSINPWNGYQWGMRGVTNDRNTKFIVLINGHKVNTESKDGFITETQLGLLGDVERIEVLRGPAGLIYGSGALAGVVNIVTRQAEKNGFEVEVRGGGWSQASAGSHIANQDAVSSKTIDVRGFWLPAPGQKLATTFGWVKDDGTGRGTTRLYGKDQWPYPNWTNIPTPSGVPSDGSYMYTPGNWRGSLDWSKDNFRLYARATHQEVSNGAFFLYDPWPNHNQADSTMTAYVDGQRITGKDAFWSQAEGWGNQRRLYVAEQYSADMTYDQPIGANNLKLEAAVDIATNRNIAEARQGYDSANGNPVSGTENGRAGISGSFGERRYTLGAMMLWRELVPRTQLATGVQQRFDDLGNDIQGYNINGKGVKVPGIKPVLYSNTALFFEGFTDVNDQLGVDFGGRWDGHTRTIDDGGTWNGKLALVYTPVQHHTFKLIAQSSSNNGSPDNYEHNGSSYDIDGMEHDGPFFDNPTDTASSLNAGVSSSELHKLKPEKTYSVEFASTHEFNDGMFYVSPSISYNYVQDMIAWAQPLLRCVNSGSYQGMNFEIEGKFNAKWLTLGANHSMQIPIGLDSASLARLADTVHGEQINKGKAGWYRQVGTNGEGKPVYAPVFNDTLTTVINPAADLIATDGKDFKGLMTNVTKVYADVKPADWMTFHTDARIFWGLAGREAAYDTMEAHGWNVGNIQSSVGVKWDASLSMRVPYGFTVSLFVYDILGEDNATPWTNDHLINTLRWGNGSNADVYAVDLRSYAVKVEKSF